MSSMPRWTPDEDRALLDLWAQNLPAQQIASILGRSEFACVSRYRAITPKDIRIEREIRRDRNRPWTEEENRTLLEGRVRGIPFPELAQSIGRPLSTCKNRHRYLLSGDPRAELRQNYWPPEDDSKLRSLRSQGIAWDQIALALGRNKNACEWRYRKIAPPDERAEGLRKQKEAQAEIMKATAAERKARKREQDKRRRPEQLSPHGYNTVFERVRPCPQALALRDSRYELEPHNLTAAIMGDPLPGYSALDIRARQSR